MNCRHEEIDEEGICKRCGARAAIRLPISKPERPDSLDMLRVPPEAQGEWIEWIEPFGPNNEPVYMRVKPETAIAVIKKAHPELTDAQALDEFIVVNWASKVHTTVVLGSEGPEEKAEKG